MERPKQGCRTAGLQIEQLRSLPLLVLDRGQCNFDPGFATHKIMNRNSWDGRAHCDDDVMSILSTIYTL
jgi:hypothetical protein